MKSNLELVKVILPYFKKYRGILTKDLIASALTTISAFVLPIILRQLTNFGADGILTWFVVMQLTVTYFILKAIEIIANYYKVNIGHRMGALIETDMRSDMYHHLMSLPNSYYTKNKVGQIMSRLTNDLFDITEFSHHGPEEILIFAIQVLGSFLVLSQLNIGLTLTIFILLPLMFWASRYFRYQMQIEQYRQRQQIGNLNANIEDSLSGISVVKSFANEDHSIENFEKGNQGFYSIKKNFYISMAGFQSITGIFEGLMYLVVLIVGGYYILSQQMVAADMIVFIMYINMLITSLQRMIQFAETFQKGLTGIQRFDEIIQTESDLKEKNDAIELDIVDGNIIFKDVDFQYQSETDKILNKLNFEVKAGEKVAFVGPSGAGKSTIIQLIPRFYDVDSGQITVDGHDVRDLTFKSLRDQIGIVQQDVYLFTGTIAENIRYGKLDATDEEVRYAAKLAGATEFIDGLPHGFDTDIGERGARLSGGQKQRISIARVFLKNPPILILDEATSALDNQSELVVQESLDSLSKGRTTITIAHRLTTIEDSDRIYVLTENGIIEEGTHAELLDAKGFYYTLYTR